MALPGWLGVSWGALGCSDVSYVVGDRGRRRIRRPGFEEGEVVVALQRRAGRAAAYVHACRWLWRITVPFPFSSFFGYCFLV